MTTTGRGRCCWTTTWSGCGRGGEQGEQGEGEERPTPRWSSEEEREEEEFSFFFSSLFFFFLSFCVFFYHFLLNCISISILPRVLNFPPRAASFVFFSVIPECREEREKRGGQNQKKKTRSRARRTSQVFFFLSPPFALRCSLCSSCILLFFRRQWRSPSLVPPR